MRGYVTKLRRTASGNFEAVVYEKRAHRLSPVLVVHGSERLVSRAVELLPILARDGANACGAAEARSGTWIAAIADDGRDDEINGG